MTSTTSRDLTALRTAMAGAVIDPGQADFDEARKVWNADIDRRPAAIARCTSAADVAAAVRFATAEGLEIAVRGGAHSVSGQSVVDDGLVIDLSPMRATGSASRRVRCSPTSTRPPRSTGSPCPRASSVTPGSPGSRSAAAWAG